MSADGQARQRYFVLVGVRIAAAAGAVFGVVLIARASGTAPRLIGTGIVLSALWMMAVVPASLARRWRTPPAP